MAFSETSLVKKNHQIATIVNQKITQKLIEKVPMTAIADSLSVSTSTVIRNWKLIQQDSSKLSDRRFYRPTFRSHLTNKEILEKLLSYSQELRKHYDLLQADTYIMAVINNYHLDTLTELSELERKGCFLPQWLMNQYKYF